MKIPALIGLFCILSVNGGEIALARFFLAGGRIVPEQELSEHAGSTYLFRALSGSVWPAGYAPLFQVESKGRVELRRLPPKGQENITEPLCFVLPMPGEGALTNAIGRWEVRGSREAQNTIFFGWEFSGLSNRLAGRFGQESDYRFAFITSSTFATNELVLAVEYVQDKFEVRGKLEKGGMRGTWRRTDDYEKGTWEAERPEQAKLPELPKVTLTLRKDMTLSEDVTGEGLGLVWK